MAVSTISSLLLLLVVAAQAWVHGIDESMEPVEQDGVLQPRVPLQMPEAQMLEEKNGNGGIQPHGNGGIQPHDELTGMKKCRTKKACSNIGGECTKKNTCYGEVVKTKKGCSKGCECCLPWFTSTPFPTETTTDAGHGPDDHFTCDNGRHIPGWWKCDGYDDCGDGSDEQGCSACQIGETKCPTGECIRDAWKCDGFEDCSDGSDETDCGQTQTGVAPQSCTGFTCGNGRCIVSSWKCDGYDDCGDNSDEKGCNKCSSTQFTCVSDGKCIAGSWKCDKYKDCSDGSDEADCKKKCQSNQFQCESSGKCITGSWKCDNYKDCDDGSDEKDCQKCTSSQFECANKKCVSSYKKCNGKDDCGDNSDEENCPTTCQCGIPNTSRIVNGVEVNPKRKYPWQIGLQSPGYYISCGGSIINDRWILTAAHCVVDKNTCRIKYDSSSSIRVALGEHNQFQTNDNDANTKKYAIKTYIKHPNYNCKTLDYDFALLELTEAIPFNNVIRPICLPKDDSKTYVGQTATVSGWGLSGTGGSMSEFLKEVQIPVLANDKCGDWYTLAGMKICAGQTGKNSCGGDSGGPLAVTEGGKMVQVGVVSYGHRSGCASSSYPSVYARVSKVISWINSNTGNGKKCN